MDCQCTVVTTIHRHLQKPNPNSKVPKLKIPNDIRTRRPPQSQTVDPSSLLSTSRSPFQPSLIPLSPIAPVALDLHPSRFQPVIPEGSDPGASHSFASRSLLVLRGRRRLPSSDRFNASHPWSPARVYPAQLAHNARDSGPPDSGTHGQGQIPQDRAKHGTNPKAPQENRRERCS